MSDLNKVVVYVRGGLVESVISNKHDIWVTVVDFDAGDNGDATHLIPIGDGDMERAGVDLYLAEHKPKEVEAIDKAEEIDDEEEDEDA